jgi:hypothetical protein
VTVHATMRAHTNRELECLVFGLALASLAQMRASATRARIPSLYSGKIRYCREPRGSERWQTALETSELGCGDCEDLVAFRCAELMAQGIKARPKVLTINPTLRHVVVRWPDGRIEDPSKKLGM